MEDNAVLEKLGVLFNLPHDNARPCQFPMYQFPITVSIDDT
jgi:hypothetical protein